MKNLGKVLRNAQVNDAKFETELLEFLRNYRATPHASTKVPPNQLLFKTRSSTSKMPNFGEVAKPIIDVIENYRKAKDTMKSYTDERLKVKPSTFSIGELVLLHQVKTHKTTTTYHPIPFKITSINGTQDTITRQYQYLGEIWR